MLARESEADRGPDRRHHATHRRPLPGADFRWRNDAGFGEIDPERCLEEAAAMRASGTHHETDHLPIRQGRLPAAARPAAQRARRRRNARRRTETHVALNARRAATGGEDWTCVYVSHIDQDHISGMLQLIDDVFAWRVFDFAAQTGGRQTRREPRRPAAAEGASSSGTTPSTIRSTRTQARSRSCWLRTRRCST